MGIDPYEIPMPILLFKGTRDSFVPTVGCIAVQNKSGVQKWCCKCFT